MATIVPATTAWQSSSSTRPQVMLRVVEVDPDVYEFAESGPEDAVIVEAEPNVFEFSTTPAVKAADAVLLGSVGHIIS